MTQNTTNATVGQPSRMVMARSRGALTGTLLVFLGIWGALVPFIGHSFGYGYTPDNTWTWTAGRGWLEVLPGVVTMISGFVIARTQSRATAMLAGWLAAASGAWFVLGTVVSPLWDSGFNGVPSGNAHHGVYEQAGMFAGLGVAIVFLAAVAIGRFSVVGVRDVAAGQARLDNRRLETEQLETERANSAPATAEPATAAPVETERSSDRPADTQAEPGVSASR